MSPLTHERPTQPGLAPPRSYASSADDLAQALMRSGVVAFALVDAGHVVAASPALRQLLAVDGPHHHVDGNKLTELAVEADRPRLEAFLRDLLQPGARADHRCRLLKTDGAAVPVLLQGAAMPVEGACQVMIVVTDLGPWVGDVPATGSTRIFEAYDPATGFATQQLMLDRLRMALAAARRYRRRTAVLHIDLEDFDKLLEALAPPAAAEAQQALASALRQGVRDCDTIARLNQREFLVLLPEVGARADAGITAARLVEDCGRLFPRGAAVRVVAAIGVAAFPADATEAAPLLAAAAAAMDGARGSPAGRFAFAAASGIEMHSIEPVAFGAQQRSGNAALDAEHQALVDATNLLIDGLRGGATMFTLERGLREIAERLEQHFSAEGLHRHALPNAAAPTPEDSPMRFLEELQCILLDVNEQSIALAIRVLRDWLGSHIAQGAIDGAAAA